MGLLDLARIFSGGIVVGAAISASNRKMDNVNLIGTAKNYYCPKCKKLTEHKYISEDELKCSECGNISEEE